MKSNKIFRTLFLEVALFSSMVYLLVGCSANSVDDSNYIAEIEHWHQLRIDSLKGKTGYLNLAGLFWLQEGLNTIGSDSANTFVFPVKAPAQLGSLYKVDSKVYFIQVKNHPVKIEDKILADTTLVFSTDTLSLTMRYNDLNWFIIQRGEGYGVRLRDYNHPLISSFDHIDNYPIDPKWHIKASWEQYDPPKIISLHNQVGMEIDQEVFGAFHFEVDGAPYILEPVGPPEGETLFVMIYDLSSGKETYGSGRYIDVPLPDENGIAYIDFNKAYNPPCAFTEFATCLFPHATNRLPFKVDAGEKYSGTH